MNDNVANDRFAPPSAHVEDVQPLATGLQKATRMQRLLGAIVDGLVVGAVVVVVVRFMPAALLNPNPWGLQLANAAVGALVFLLLQGFFLATRQQTLGKMLLKTRICRPDGSAPSLLRLFGVRYGVGMVLGLVPMVAGVYSIVDALCIFGKSCRCLHDMIADTVVLKA